MKGRHDEETADGSKFISERKQIGQKNKLYKQEKNEAEATQEVETTC